MSAALWFLFWEASDWRAVSLSGSTSFAFTTTATLQSTTTVSAVSAVTFTTAGALGSVTSLSGVSTVAFATAGNLTSTAALSGAISPLFATAGALTSTTSLSGTVTVAFTTAGNLTSTAGLAGAVAPAFTVGPADLTLTEAAAPVAAASKGGAYYNWSPKLERKRRKAWDAARRAREELRELIEAVAEGKPQPVAEVRRAIKVAEVAAVAAEPLPDTSGLVAEIAELRDEFERLTAAAEDEEMAVVMLLAA